MLHVIRRTYWIIRGRAHVKSHVNKCITCRRHRGAVAQQKMGDLPSQRVNRHRQFSISGVDYCGPFTLRVGAKRTRTTTKAHVVIFVCLATKAVHIELASDLSTAAFLNAFARFVNRRGVCNELHSDNGTRMYDKIFLIVIRAPHGSSFHQLHRTGAVFGNQLFASKNDIFLVWWEIRR